MFLHKVHLNFTILLIYCKIITSHAQIGGEKVTELEEIYNNYFKDVYLFIYSLSKDPHMQ